MKKAINLNKNKKECMGGSRGDKEKYCNYMNYI